MMVVCTIDGHCCDVILPLFWGSFLFERVVALPKNYDTTDSGVPPPLDLEKNKKQNCDAILKCCSTNCETRPDGAQSLFQPLPVDSDWDCAEFSQSFVLLTEREVKTEGFCNTQVRLLGTTNRTMLQRLFCFFSSDNREIANREK